MKRASIAEEGAEQVDEFMNALEHPLKAEVNMLREIIKSVNKDITDQSSGRRLPSAIKGNISLPSTFAQWNISILCSIIR